MYLEYHADGHFEAATATLRVINSEYPYIELEDLMWIGATKDGGASPWITHIKKRKLPKYIGESGMSEIWEEPEWHTDEDLPPTQKDNSCEMKPLHAHCHCNGVRFWIAPPTTAASHIPDTPFPDLLVPYWATESSKRSNSDNKPWWLKDSKDRGKRYLAGFCACNSCRRMSGFDLTAWAFIPSTSIFLDEACTVPFTFPTGPASPNTSPDPRTLNLKAYESSTGVLRSFCSTCGAKVFWDGRAGSGKERVVDVAVGLLDAPSGARAEEILSWHLGRVSFKEEAANMLLVTSLEEGMQACSERLTES